MAVVAPTTSANENAVETFENFFASNFHVGIDKVIQRFTRLLGAQLQVAPQW